jgi:UDPglucose--hexose-1-phosphate uridylyltransferase
MSELRRDPVTGRWVCLAPGRAERPEAEPRPADAGAAVVEDCPFCEGHEDRTPPELAAYRPGGGPPDSPGWQVRVVPNLYPAFSFEEGGPADLGNALHAHGPALGACEVIINSPDHRRWLPYLADAQAELVMTMTWERYRAHRVSGVGSLVALYNHGKEAGASLAHPHGQIYSTRVVGPVLEEEYRGAETAHRALGACVFCRMIEEESSQDVRVVARAEHFVAIAPYASRQPYECWILPTAHIADFGESAKADAAALGRFLKVVLWKLTSAAGAIPLNWYIHSLPNAAGDWRESYHWHLEIRPKLTQVASFELATGTYINTLAPEVAAANLVAETDPPAGESEPPV